MLINTPISVGELIDKITILEIKQTRINDADKLVHINNELLHLTAIVTQYHLQTDKLKQLKAELKTINKTLWDIEDDIRACERAKNFSELFIELARKVYYTNDLRANLKYQINSASGSELFEVKSYESYV